MTINELNRGNYKSDGTFVSYDPMRSFPTEVVLRLNDKGMNIIREKLAAHDVFTLDESFFFDNATLSRIKQIKKLTGGRNSWGVASVNLKCLFNNRELPIVINDYVFSGFGGRHTDLSRGVTASKSFDIEGINIKVYQGMVVSFTGNSSGYVMAGVGSISSLWHPISTNIADRCAAHPLVGDQFDNDEYRWPTPGGMYSNIDIDVVLFAKKINFRTHEVTFMPMPMFSFEESIYTPSGSTNQFKFVWNFKWPTVEILEAIDSWHVTDIPYNISENIPNGTGNLQLASSNAPSVVGYGKSQYSYQDSNGVTKILTPSPHTLDVYVSRSYDDTYTTVTINNTQVTVNDMMFTLLVLHDKEGTTYISQISSPLPGETRQFSITLPITSNVDEIIMDTMFHQAVRNAITNLGSVQQFYVDLNVATGMIHMSGSVTASKGKNNVLVIHLLPIFVHYYPRDNSNTTTILNQAFTIKLDVTAINDTVQISTGLSSINYSTATTEGLNMKVLGVSRILPTNFTPYLRSVQLDSEAMVVNGDTIGFTVNVDKLVNKQILGTSTGYTEYYLGGKK